MTQALIPRPIAWVLTQNADGSKNLAPFSYFSAVSSEPPLIMLSIGRRSDGAPKDTAANIEARKHFVVHIPHRDVMGAVNESAASLPAGESEVEALGLELAEFPGAELPRLAQCRLAMACELHEIQQIGASPQSLIFGQVRQLYLDDGIVSQGDGGRLKIHADRLDPVGRLGAGEYMGMGEIIELARPK
ncbi:flavin reductase family protein [Solemya velesiana gill symbiont]|uniref:Protein/domain typically associated with flavoprotein oxygenase, DIM6/NTAB family protein n=1 Tax=Solemya velesiana gill symbiont TaxID=1918948 RepID=A0A1T2KYG1_9GAMM|nr:flavin reductase family protein [Solemya velesiana gill symbiont]OOZ37872.1 protein/domain typically associated with flavoprotein oxygenase, DIM6/NTAB family protein [Solemya velesiana gill symbiont]